VELEPEADELVHALLEGQLDVEPDRVGVRLAGAAVGGLHDPRAAARDDREPGLAEHPGGFAGERVLPVVSWRAGGAEDRHGGPDVGQRVEAGAQLELDALEPIIVGERRQHRRLLGGDDLLVERCWEARAGAFHGDHY
jgi:hypothetical protein